MGIGILWDTLLTKKKHVPHVPCQIYVKSKAVGQWSKLHLILVGSTHCCALRADTSNSTMCGVPYAVGVLGHRRSAPRAKRTSACNGVCVPVDPCLQLGVPHPITCWSFQRQLVKKHVANSKHKLFVIDYLPSGYLT